MGYDRALYRRVRDGSQDYKHRRKYAEDAGNYSPEHYQAMLSRHRKREGGEREYLQPGREVKGKIVWPHYVREMLREMEDAE